MRNKSAFMKPNVSNSFRKSDRHYPQPQSITPGSQYGKHETQITHQIQQQIPQQKIHVKRPLILCHSNDTFKFDFLVHTPFKIPSQTKLDKTCIWYHNIPNNMGKNKTRKIQFKCLNYVLLNWTGDQFYSNLYICIQNFNGLKDINGIPTDRVCCLQMVQINPVIDGSNTRTYDVRYQSKQNIQWEIPHQLTYLKFHLKIDQDEDYTQFPLNKSNPLKLNFEIKY